MCAYLVRYSIMHNACTLAPDTSSHLYYVSCIPRRDRMHMCLHNPRRDLIHCHKNSRDRNHRSP